MSHPIPKRQKTAALHDARARFGALVEPYSGREFGIPRFYRDEVVYVRSNMPWEITPMKAADRLYQ